MLADSCSSSSWRPLLLYSHRCSLDGSIYVFCQTAAPPVWMMTLTFSGSWTSSISIRSVVAKPPLLSRSLPQRYQYIAQLPSAGVTDPASLSEAVESEGEEGNVFSSDGESSVGGEGDIVGASPVETGSSPQAARDRHKAEANIKDNNFFFIFTSFPYTGS